MCEVILETQTNNDSVCLMFDEILPTNLTTATHGGSSEFRHRDLQLGAAHGMHGRFFFPCVGTFISPYIDTRLKGPRASNASSEINRQDGVNEMAGGGFEPRSHRPTVRCSNL